ncbi:adenylate/guanylate cyclase domain-containing protein [Corallococcus silvisoli]|uniref:adenylate/guanylate cyclase domain-containing protein n=1 Tax=Corallococcus silvisoli TaxID=2697031 RepID=UPI00137855B0|nr:adenylate/guanylate cyclase domain-containing protein [Corallococcus silvisoli]NBD08742.1 GAF domain-containing protein [Corallococcus silvisoli]
MRLILNPGQVDERAVMLPEGVTTVGRTEENGIRVPHPSLSRRHARLERMGERVVLVDLDSKNGSYVGPHRVSRQELTPGQSFRCGEVWFRLVSSDTPLPEGWGPLRTQPLETRYSGGPMESLLDTRSPDRTHDKLQVLLKVGQLLSSPGPVEGLLERVVHLVFQIWAVDRAAVLLVDRDTGALVPRVSRGARGGALPERFYSQHIVDYVHSRGVAALFSDAKDDARLLGADSVFRQSIRASLCVPLRTRDTVLGVLYLDSLKQGGLFTEEDLEFLTAFANQAAIALDHAHLARRLEEEAVLRNAYQRFFPPDVVRQLKALRGVPLDVRDADVTILFSDITGFTAMSSRLRPRQVVDMLNAYFPVMADIVFRHEGTLEKYIGDALMAVWGAPFARPDDADRAVRAALEMQHALAALNARWRQEGAPEVHVHIGLNSGPVAAGNIGSERYLQYATVGDATNVAARVCGVARPGEVLVTDATRALLDADAFTLEPLGPVTVKGREAPVSLFRVRG